MRTEYIYRLLTGKAEGVELFDSCNHRSASICLLNGGTHVSVRSRLPFRGYQKVWDYHECKMFDPKEQDFGVRFQYEAVFRQRFSQESLRNWCIDLFEVDPGPVPPDWTEEERKQKQLECGLENPR